MRRHAGRVDRHERRPGAGEQQAGQQPERQRDRNDRERPDEQHAAQRRRTQAVGLPGVQLAGIVSPLPDHEQGEGDDTDEQCESRDQCQQQLRSAGDRI